MMRYLLLGLAFVACGPEELPGADPILHAGASCSFSRDAALCSGQGQQAVTCDDGRYVAFPQSCKSLCRAPGDYCDLGYQSLGAKCAGSGKACIDATTSAFCSVNGAYEEPIDCSNLGGCDTVNGMAGCRKFR